VTYYLASNPEAQRKLQRELDDALGPLVDDSEDPAQPFDSLKSLPYLAAVINESLRLHSTSAIGLPRIVPESSTGGGDPRALAVAGHAFEPGTVLSVPSFTIHRAPEVWGADVEAFRPERWFEEDKKEAMARTFNPFSYGPRGCVGKNLANEEMTIIVGSVFRRYEIVMEDMGAPVRRFRALFPPPPPLWFVWVLTACLLWLETREGFLRKPLACRVGIRRRW
jgi:benzoate 4-monooxygenase